MKKVIFALLVMVTLASCCGGNKCETPAADSTATDSLKVDSTLTVKDSVKVLPVKPVM